MKQTIKKAQNENSKKEIIMHYYYIIIYIFFIHLFIQGDDILYTISSENKTQNDELRSCTKIIVQNHLIL